MTAPTGDFLHFTMEGPEPLSPRERRFLVALNLADRALRAIRLLSWLKLDGRRTKAVDEGIEAIEGCFDGICRRCFEPSGEHFLCLSCDNNEGELDVRIQGTGCLSK